MLIGVPIVSAFFGITIRMFFQEHEPAHFHAEHQRQFASFDLEGKLIQGEMKSARARRLIRRWAKQNRQGLLENWERSRTGMPLDHIPPLT